LPEVSKEDPELRTLTTGVSVSQLDSLLFFFLQEIRNTKEKQKGENSVIEEADPQSKFCILLLLFRGVSLPFGSFSKGAVYFAVHSSRL